MYVCSQHSPGTTRRHKPGFPHTAQFEWSQYFWLYTGHTIYSMWTGTNKSVFYCKKRGSFGLTSQYFTMTKGLYFGLKSQCFTVKKIHFELKSQYFAAKKSHFQTGEQGCVPLFPIVTE